MTTSTTITNLVVITGTKATEITVPADPPIKDWIDEAVDFLARAHNGDEIDFEFDQDTVWSLARVGAPPIEREESLNSADIVDGTMVRLVPVSYTERYRPLVEDIIDGVAVLNPDPVFKRDDVYRWMSWLIPAVAIAVAAASVVGWSANENQRLWWGPALLLLGGAAGTAGYYVWRRYDQIRATESLFTAAGLLVPVGAALTIPLPRDATWLAAPNAAAAGFAMLLTAIALRGGPRRRHTITAALAAGGVVTTLIALALGYGWHQWVWPAAIAVGLFLITSAAKLTVLFARFTLPPVPAAGEPVDIEDLLDPVVDVAAESGGDPARETWKAILESVPSSSARLVERSALAQQLLGGFVTVGAATLAVGAVMTFQRGHFFWHSLAIAILVAIATAFRSRFYANHVCAWALLTGSAAIVLGCASKIIAWNQANAAFVVAGVVLLTTVTLVAFAATRGVKLRSAVSKRALERLDGLTVASIVPLLLWVAGVYNFLRNLVI